MRAAIEFIKTPNAKEQIAHYAASVFAPQRTAQLMLERLDGLQKILVQRNWV